MLLLALALQNASLATSIYLESCMLPCHVLAVLLCDHGSQESAFASFARQNESKSFRI